MILNSEFSVTGLPGISATDNACLDMDSGETTAPIAAKIEKAQPTLNFNYWNGKNIKAYLAQLRALSFKKIF